MGFSQEESSREKETVHPEGNKGLERRINISDKDWYALKHGILFEWPSNYAIKSTAWLHTRRNVPYCHFLLPSCIVK